MRRSAAACLLPADCLAAVMRPELEAMIGTDCGAVGSTHPSTFKVRGIFLTLRLPNHCKMFFSNGEASSV